MIDPSKNLISPATRDAIHFFHRTGRVLAVAAGLVLLYFILQALEGILFPLAFSMILAYLLDPLIDKLEARRIPRSVGILLCLSVGLLAIFIFSVGFYPTIVREAGRVVEKFPGFVNTLETRTVPFLEQTFGLTLPPTVSAAFQQYGSGLGDMLPSILNRASSWLATAALKTGSVISSILNLVLIPVFTFYFLRDFDVMKSKAVVFLPEYRRAFFLDRLQSMDAVVGRWFRGQIEVAGILALLYAIGLGFVFGFSGIDARSGAAIGLLTGLLNIVPYLGAVTGFTLSLLVILIEWSGFGSLVGLVSVFVVVQVLEGYVITPRIVGEKVGLGPVAVLIVILTGGQLFGIPGVLLAIPVTAALKVVFPDILDWYKSTSFYRGPGDNPKAPASAHTRKASPARVRRR